MIRTVNENDAERLVEIYSYYVKETAVSFEYKVPSVEEFKNRIRTIASKYPYLVYEIDGEVLGYAYASAYSVREAYNWTATTSIYINKSNRRQGIGTALYKELEARLFNQGIVNILAGVAYIDTEDEFLTHDSYEFHKKMKYKEVAHMIKIGKKFDRWYDLLWMQKVNESLQAEIILSELSYNNSVMILDENGEIHKQPMPDPVEEKLIVKQGDRVKGFEVLAVTANFIELSSSMEYTTANDATPRTHFFIEKGECINLNMYGVYDAVYRILISYIETVESSDDTNTEGLSGR